VVSTYLCLVGVCNEQKPDASSSAVLRGRRWSACASCDTCPRPSASADRSSRWHLGRHSATQRLERPVAPRPRCAASSDLCSPQTSVYWSHAVSNTAVVNVEKIKTKKNTHTQLYSPKNNRYKINIIYITINNILSDLTLICKKLLFAFYNSLLHRDKQLNKSIQLCTITSADLVRTFANTFYRNNF